MWRRLRKKLHSFAENAKACARKEEPLGSKPFLGLQARLSLAFLLVSLIPLGVLYYLNATGAKEVLTAGAYRSLYAAASQTAARLDSFVSNNLAVIEAEAQIPALAEFISLGPDERSRPSVVEHMTKLLSSLQRKDRVYISSIALLNLDGDVVADTDPTVSMTNLSSRNYFKQAMESGLPFASSVLFSQIDGKAYIYFSCPINDVAGKPVGVLRTRYGGSLIQERVVVDNDLAGPGSFPLVLDENNILLAYGHVSHLAAFKYLFKMTKPLSETDAGRLQVERLLAPGPVSELVLDLPELSQGMGYVGRSEPYFTAFLPTHDRNVLAGAVTYMKTLPLRVAFVQPEAIFLEPIHRQANITLILAAIIGVVAAVIGIVVANLLSKPIVRLTRTVEKVAEGDLTAREEVCGNSEVDTLARTFNDMTSQLQMSMHNLEQTVEERTEELTNKAQELEKANWKLRELDQLKSSLLSSVSHELRTPLTSVLGFSKLIRKDFKRLRAAAIDDEVKHRKFSERITGNLGIIEKESLRLTRMINDFLDLTKIEAGRMLWDDRCVGATDVLMAVADSMQGLFSGKRSVEFIVDIPPDLLKLHVDPDRIEQVFINLLSNAEKFTSDGTVTLSARMNDGGMLEVHILDTGTGIPEAEVDKIFDKFHQVQTSHRERNKPLGTGLGLAITHQIVSRYGGKIRVNSTVGEGSLFVVELPVVSQCDSAAEDEW